MNSHRNTYRGTAYIAILLAVVILMIIGTSLFGIALQGRLRSIRANHQIAARCAADAGMQKALFEMNQKLLSGPWNPGSLPGGTVTIAPTQQNFTYSVSLNNGSYTIQSTGACLEAGKTSQASLRLVGLFEYAIYVLSTIELKNGSTIDGYNYDPGDPIMQIGTRSTQPGSINLKNGVTVNSDVIVGFDGDPIEVINGNLDGIIGDIYAMPLDWDPPLISPPAYLAGATSKGTLGGGTTVSTSGKYDNINLGNNQIVTIDGNVELYVTGDIDLKNSAEIQITDTGSLTLYLGGNIDGKNGSAFNNLHADAATLTIYGLETCVDIIFHAKDTFYGTIYAPRAKMDMKNSTDFYGAIITDSLELKAKVDFHFDANLREVDVNDLGVRFLTDKWSEL